MFYNILLGNAFVHCRLHAYLASGGFAPRLPLGLYPWTRWGTSIPQAPVPTLPPNPGYATANTSHGQSVYKIWSL